MSKEIGLENLDKQTTEQENINVGEIIGKYLYHWPVFVLGISFALIIAFLYLRYTQPVYEISSTLLIKDEKKRNVV